MSDIKITRSPLIGDASQSGLTGVNKNVQTGASTQVNRVATHQASSVEISKKVLDLKARIESGSYNIDANKLADKIFNIISS